MLENMKAAGAHQAYKADRISLISIVDWPGEQVCAESRYIGRRIGAPRRHCREAIEVAIASSYPEFPDS